MPRLAWVLAVGVLMGGCASTGFTPRTLDCGRLAPVPNPSGRIELASLGVSIIPPQADRWCMSPLGSDFFTFNTHPLMGKYLDTAPTPAEMAHTVGILVTSGAPPKDAKLDAPEDLVAFAQRMVLGALDDSGSWSPRPFGTPLWERTASDSTRRSKSATTRGRRAPYSSSSTVRTICAVIRTRARRCSSCSAPANGTSRERDNQPLLLDTLKTQWEPSVRSVQFLRPR